MYLDCSINGDLRTTGAKRGGPPEDSAPQSGERAVSASLPLSKAHIRPQIVYRAGCSILKSTKGQKFPQVAGGKRGNVRGFSRQSRYRLMILIGEIRKDAELPNFVTLTYPAEFPTVERSKRDLKIFLQRLNRKFPEAGYIWKLEPQERSAPHFHLLVWGVSTRTLYQWVSMTWYEIAGNGDKNALLFLLGALKDSKPCVSKVRSWRGVWSYASKYLGKTFEVAGWAEQWTGRYWGVGKRENIPFGEEIIIDCDYKKVVQIMRYQRRFAKLKRGSSNSLTVFCDADQWVRKLVSYPKSD